jgi:hypothetical protein
MHFNVYKMSAFSDCTVKQSEPFDQMPLTVMMFSRQLDE